MRFCVYGAGAIGGYLAVELALAGHEVCVVARGAHLAAIRQNGLTLLIGGQRKVARVVSMKVSSTGSTPGGRPSSKLGMMVPEFPNFFMLYGPNSQPLSGGTGLHAWYLVWASYAAQCIVKMVEQGLSRVEVKREAYERYNADLDKAGAELVLMKKEGGVEKNYYVNNEHGHLQVSAPWISQEFHRMCTQVDWDDLEVS